MKVSEQVSLGSVVSEGQPFRGHGILWYIFCGTIRRMLISLVLAAILPALGIILYSGLEARKHTLKDAEASSLLLSRSVGEIQERTTQAVSQMLVILSNAPQVQDARNPDASAFLERMARGNPILANIVVADLNGELLASAVPFSGTVNLSDREYFKAAMRNDAFTPGEYQVGKITKLPVYSFAHAVHDEQGRMTGVIVAYIRLDALQELIGKADLPSNSVMSIADRGGIRICRFPADETIPLGLPLPKLIWDAIAGSGDQGITIQQGGDGVWRVFAFTKLRLTPVDQPYQYVLVGIPEKHSIALANAELKRNMSLLAATALLALGIAWVLGKLMLVNRIERLVVVTEKVGTGDLAARVGPRSTTSELGRLEKAVDTMAAALAKDAEIQKRNELELRNAYEDMELRVAERTRELQDANDRLRDEIGGRVLIQEALRESEEKHRSLYEQAPVGILLLDALGRVVDANPAASRMLGYSPAEMRRTVYRELIAPDGLQANPIDLKSISDGKAIRLERVFLTREGKELPVNVSASKVKDGTIQVIFRDATERKKLEQLRTDVESMTRHDLKTPLLGIVQIPALLLKGDNLTPKQREFLQLLHDSGHRMLRTINMSLSLYRMEVGTYEYEPTAFDLLKAVRQVVEGTRLFADSQGVAVSMLLDYSEPDPSRAAIVVGEEHLCSTMLENLVKNAVESSPENETVVIKLESSKRTLTVWNKGEVPEAIRAQFFEKYVTSGKKWGTGLGTYSAWLIAKICNWDISLDVATPGETSVIIHFPEA